MKGDAPVEVGGLDEAKPFWFGRGDEYEISGNGVVGLEANNVSDTDIFPFAPLEGGGGREYLGNAGVELRVGLVSFLEENEKVDRRKGGKRLTRSSWSSLKAVARRTTMRGTMVVYWFVGETFGICWMQAVKRKNRLAYLENCSVGG